MPPPDVEVARIATTIPGRVIREEVLVVRVHQTLLDKPEKSWKFSASRVRERRYWDDYMHTYEEVVRATATKGATWYVVPADHKWFTRLVVAAAILEAVENLDLTCPTGAEEGARRGTRRTRGREMSRLAPAERG